MGDALQALNPRVVRRTHEPVPFVHGVSLGYTGMRACIQRSRPRARVAHLGIVICGMLLEHANRLLDIAYRLRPIGR